MNRLRREVVALQEAEREEAHRMLMTLLDSTAALETLVEDICVIVARALPDQVGELRDQTAAAYQRSLDGTASPGALGWEGFWSNRWAILEAAMARIGRPHTGAQVVSLDAVRRGDANASDTEAV